MGLVTIAWSVAAGFSLAIAVVAGAVGAERRNLASQTIVLLGVALAGVSYVELLMMHSATPQEYGEWVRWYHVPFFFAVLAQVLFVHFYLGTGRSWLMWTVVAMRLAVVVENFAVRPNFNFVTISKLGQERLLGEQVSTIGSAVSRQGWQWFALASLVLMMAYLLDALIQQWRIGRRSSRRKAIAIGLCIAVPWLCTSAMAVGQLIAFGAISGLITNLPWFLGALLVMMFEMSRDHVLGRRALEELAEVRRHQMQQDRISILAQLSPALAHQLAQPLAANVANAVVALRHLERNALDLDELRAILTDINNDSRRGAELIACMRQLLKNHTLEIRPVDIKEVVHEAISLVQPEAAGKSVMLSSDMQADLPPALADRVHLSQVLINLILNGIQAVQCLSPDARLVVVEARTSIGNRYVELTVRDSGRGIPDGLADKVFEPFFTTKPEGMGMGLALSRTIIEAHGGALWLDRTTANLPGGAIFRIRLESEDDMTRKKLRDPELTKA
jgi:signal transduction histidine kinase